VTGETRTKQLAEKTGYASKIIPHGLRNIRLNVRAEARTFQSAEFILTIVPFDHGPCGSTCTYMVAELRLQTLPLQENSSAAVEKKGTPWTAAGFWELQLLPQSQPDSILFLPSPNLNSRS
jgi:hypothetical protein